MTTTVKIFPSPAEGFKTRVSVNSAVDNSAGEYTYLRVGDPEMVVHVHDDKFVIVREVPDVKPEDTPGTV